MKALLLSLLAVIIFGSGYALAYQKPPEVVEVQKVIERHYTENITEVIYVDRPVIQEKIVYVDKPVPVVQTQLRYFNDLAELIWWLDTQDFTNEIDPTGTGINQIDCDNYAYILQANANRDGYQASVVRVNNDTHSVNTFRIGNYEYYVEPQNDVIFKKEPLD